MLLVFVDDNNVKHSVTLYYVVFLMYRLEVRSHLRPRFAKILPGSLQGCAEPVRASVRRSGEVALAQ